jgi:CelD/BcsL family acetyltransferase involved in cellulose biosynthesis
MSGDVLKNEAGASPGYDVRWLRTLQDIDAFAPQWVALDQSSQAQFVWFQSFNWCRNWVARHMGKLEAPRILVVLKDGRPEAILPLILTRTMFGVKSLEVLGQPHTQYSNILTPSGVLDERAIAKIRTALKRQADADTTIFNYVPEGSALAQVLADVPSAAHLANEASMLDLTRFGEGQSFESTRSPHAQKRLRRHIRLFEKDFGKLNFTALRPGEEGYSNLVAHCVTMKKQWISATGKLGTGLMRFDHAAFLAALEPITDTDGPLLWVLRGESKLLAVEIGFIQRGHYYCYISGFDIDLWKHSPGKLQKAMTINGLIDMGATAFDLMGNTTDYKDDYANRRVALSGAIISSTTRGKLYAGAWVSHVEPAIRKVFFALPDRMRNSIATARRSSFASALPSQMDASKHPSGS